MSAMVRQRRRIARLRRVQHVAAAAAFTEAEAKATALEGSATRLGALRRLLMDQDGAVLGMQLASAHELAGRLELARHGLTDAIIAARGAVAERERTRLAARIDQEGADKLFARAAADAAARSERRPVAPQRRRKEEAE